jgi:hypothetical protein
MTRRFGEHDAKLKNVLLAGFGMPPAARPAAHIEGLENYFPHHLGFDHRRLAAILREHFSIETTLASPFHLLGAWANSELYFRVRLGGGPG